MPLDLEKLPSQHPLRRRAGRDIDQARAEKLAKLAVERDALLAKPVVVGGKKFSTGVEVAALRSAKARKAGQSVVLRDADGKPCTLTKQQAAAIDEAAAAHIEEVWDSYWAKHDAVVLASTVESVDAV